MLKNQHLYERLEHSIHPVTVDKERIILASEVIAGSEDQVHTVVDEGRQRSSSRSAVLREARGVSE